MQTNSSCGVCGESLADERKTTVLFGTRVSRKCGKSFNEKRMLAYVLDAAASLAIGLGAASVFAPTDPTNDRVWFLIMWSVSTSLMLVKDSWRGTSPGKWLCGLQVVDVDHGGPIGIRQSVVRNLPAVVHGMAWPALIVAHRMRFGPRDGEKWARTRVIVRKHRDAPAFVSTGADEIWTDPRAI